MLLEMPKRQKHLGELDSLRGIAAGTVMFFHFYLLWEESPHPRWEENLFVIPPSPQDDEPRDRYASRELPVRSALGQGGRQDPSVGIMWVSM
jgi:hypothetical protein